MRSIFFFTIVILLVGCEARELPKDQIKYLLSNFNRLATESYTKNYINSEDFRFMSPMDKCFLDVVITKHLDMYNDWNLAVVDSFYVRSFYEYSLYHRITFVATEEGKFYFLYAPEVQELYYGDDHYTRDSNGNSVLKDSIGHAIIKLNTPNLEIFLRNEIHKIKDLKQQADQMEHLLEYIWEDLFFDRAGSPLELVDLATRGRSKEHNEEIMNIINPIINHNNNRRYGKLDRYHVYKNWLGFSIVHFTQSETSKLELNIYFVPVVDRPKLLSDSEPIFRDCYKQFQ